MRLKRIVFAFSVLILGTAATCHAAYDLVEWIQANSLGNAWINSGATPESEEVVYEVEWVETSQESLTALFGATAWSGSTALYGTVGYHSSAGKIAFWTGRSSSICEFTDITANVTNTMSVVVQNKQISVTKNGTTKGPVAYTGYVTNREDIAILADRDRTKGTSGMNGAKEICKYTRLHLWMMTDNGVVKRIMLPAVERDTGKAGLVDLATGEFFGSAGPGEFTCGAVVTNAATQFTDGQKAALEAADGTLVVEGTPENYGEVSPAYGIATGIANGSNIAMQVTSPEFTNLSDTERVVCTGAVVCLVDVATGEVTNAVPHSGRSFNYVHAGHARVEWLWKTQFYTSVTNTDGGAVSSFGAWGDEAGATLAITATPATASGYIFSHWTGDILDTVSGAATDATITLDHARARSVTAVFKRVGIDLVEAGTFTGDCVYTKDGTNSVFKFTNVTQSATLTIAKTGLADILVVGGGGGGGATIGGGGGAGGVIWQEGITLPAGTYTINVGAGGAAGANWYQGGNGVNSTISNATFSLVAIGGGGGGGWSSDAGRSGGSGGGASNNRTSDAYRGLGTDGQGHDGALCSGSNGYCGGGGGAGEDGEVGGATQANYSGFGGDGIVCDITGEEVWYGGGGGAGAGNNSTYGGLGGQGGGGNGADRNTNKAGQPGTDGLGGGGGGGGFTPATSGGKGGGVIQSC